MTLRLFRDAAIADIKLGMPVFKDVDSAPRTITTAWVKRVSTQCPACFIGFTKIPMIKRSNVGTFVGPVELMANVIAKDKSKKDKAQDIVLDLMSDLAAYVERRNFGVERAGVAEVTAIENLFSIDQDQDGIAIGTVTFRNQYEFGHDFLAEDLRSDNAKWPGTLRTIIAAANGGDPVVLDPTGDM